MQQQILTVVLADTHRTRMAIVHENESIPYQRRTVQIELTPEQMAAIAPRKVGFENGCDVYEEMYSSWLEPRR